MKFRQKVFLFSMIVIADMILFGGAVRLWRGRTEMDAVRQKKQVNMGIVSVQEEAVSGEAAGNDRGEAERTGNPVSDMPVIDIYGQQESPQKKYVALTFDDGPNSKYTKPLLDGLKERGIRASFFLVGECIDGKEDLVKQMAADGHLIGVHCQTHKDLTKEKLSDAKKELCDTREKIQEVTGLTPEYVRPPYGSWNAKLEEAVDMIPVFWDVDSIDWRLKNTEKVTAKVLKDTEDGDIILMHDEFKTSVEAALRIIDNLTAKGYTFVTVDELMVD